jgi:hypothetical protein
VDHLARISDTCSILEQGIAVRSWEDAGSSLTGTKPRFGLRPIGIHDAVRMPWLDTCLMANEEDAA